MKAIFKQPYQKIEEHRIGERMKIHTATNPRNDSECLQRKRISFNKNHITRIDLLQPFNANGRMQKGIQKTTTRFKSNYFTCFIKTTWKQH